MEIHDLGRSKDETKMRFMLKGVSTAYANSLRRIMINKVPTLAIEEIEFRKNSSALYDENIAHRLGLIPLETDLDSYVLPSKCKCEGKGCAQCQLKLTLKAKGPCMVYASDIKSKDPKVKPVYSKMPVVKLLKSQEIELSATAVMGVGKEHIKWAPGLVYYRHPVNISVHKNSFDGAENVAKQCPAGIFNFKNEKLSVNKDNVEKCIFCGACTDLSKNNEVTVEADKGSFMFFVESWGQLKCKEIVKEAVKVFNETLEEFCDKIKGTE